MEKAMVLIINERGMPDVAHTGDVDVLVIDLDTEDEIERADQLSRLTPEWRDAFPDLIEQYSLQSEG